MNIKVAAFTVSEKSSNTQYLQYDEWNMLLIKLFIRHWFQEYSDSLHAG